MANVSNKKTSQNTPKHSGFDAPCKGIVLSKNSTITKNAEKLKEVKRWQIRQNSIRQKILQKKS